MVVVPHALVSAVEPFAAAPFSARATRPPAHGFIPRHPASLAPGVPFAQRRAFSRAAYLQEAGTPADTVFLLRHGQVRLFLLSPDGHETVTSVLGPGHVVGLSALVRRPTHHAFAQALSAVEAWQLPVEPLTRNLATDTRLLGALLGSLTQQVALEEALLRNAVLLRGAERLHDTQARLAASAPGVHLTGAALASLLGLRPETLSRLRHGQDETDSDPEATAITNGPGQPAVGNRGPAVTSVPAGDRIPPAAPGCVQLVRAGRVRLFLAGPDGREVFVSTLGPGDLLSLTALTGLPPLELHAEAESETAISSLTLPDLLNLLDGNPALARQLITHIARRLLELDARLVSAQTPTTRQRLAAFLHELTGNMAAPLAGSTEWVPLPGQWTHATIARYVGRTRESVTRGLAELKREGYVRREQAQLFVAVRRLSDDFELNLR